MNLPERKGLLPLQNEKLRNVAVVVTFGRTESYVLSERLHFVLPWQNVIKMDNRAQKESVTLSAFSSDIQQVEVCLLYTSSFIVLTACTVE